MVRAKRAKRATGFHKTGTDGSSDEDEFIDNVKLELGESKASSTATNTPAPRNRIENLRERIQLFYGTTNEELIRALQLRVKWGNLMFSPGQIELDMFQGPTPSPVGNSVLSHLKKGLKTETVTGTNGHACTVDGTVLNPQETRVCENVGAILNTGFSVISLDWSSSNLLAVSVHVTDQDPMNASTLYDMAQSPTLIYVYSVEGTKVSIRGKIEGSYGVAKIVKWRPFGSELCVVLGNGQVGVVQIDSDFENDALLDLKPFPQIGSAQATCACWRSPENIVVGYDDGHIAEFCVAQFADPSFVVRAHSSVITALAAGWPDYGSTIFASSVDGWSCVFEDINDLRLVHKAPRLKYFANCACYSPYADSFVSLEDMDTTKLVPWRKPELVQAQTALTRHNSGVSSVAASQAHPLVISGGQDGELHISNPLRRTMVTRRNRDVHMDCTVWRLECSHKTSQYRFADVLSASALPKRKLPNHLPVYPSVVTLSDLCWQPNSAWYAAGTLAGLIRIENTSV